MSLCMCNDTIKITDTYMQFLLLPKGNVKQNFVIKKNKINLAHLAKILTFPCFLQN